MNSLQCAPVCAAFEVNEHLRLKPGMPAAFWRAATKAQERVWTGFARVESLAWWLGNGGALVDIPAARFAERSRRTGLLVWADMPAGCVIRGLTVEEHGKPHLKVVTRASSEGELAVFEHDRMPLLEAPLFSREAIAYDQAALVGGEQSFFRFEGI